MAALLTNLLSGGGLSGISKVIDSIRGKSPEDAAKLEGLKLQYAAQFQESELDLQKKTLESYNSEVQAAAGVIKAEANSQSWLPRNVRPLLLLVWGLAISVNVLVGIYAHYFHDASLTTFPLDPWVYKLTAIGYTGYVTARTWEKVTDSLPDSSKK